MVALSKKQLDDVEVLWISVILEDCIDYVDVINYTKTPDDINAFNKRIFIKNVLVSTLEEIQHRKSFESLNAASEEEAQKQKDFLKKKNKVENTLWKITVTKKMICQLKLKTQYELDKLEMEENEFMLQMENLVLLNSEKNQSAKEKHKHNVHNCMEKRIYEEDIIHQEMQICKNKMRLELVINCIMDTYLKDTIVELLNDINQTEEQFCEDNKKNESEFEELDKQIKTLTVNIKDLKDKCDIYAQTISEDKMEKMISQQKIEEEIKLNKIIIHLQSWWRGMMVRRGIGPYAKKKKRKKKPKKGMTNTERKAPVLQKPEQKASRRKPN